MGLIQNEPTAFPGYNLLAPMRYPEVFLLDNCGRIVHKWETGTYPTFYVYLLENGDLLKASRPNISSLEGNKIERWDWEGNLVWEYKIERQDHDIEPLPNGNILVLVKDEKTEAEAIAAGKVGSGDVTSTSILELEPIGNNQANVVWEWHLWDHLIQDFDETKENFGEIAEHPELVDINYPIPIDLFSWWHPNSIDYNAELDQILISSNNTGEIFIIDHSTTTAEAATHSGGNSGKGGDFLYRWGNPSAYHRGLFEDRKLYGQHDAYWIPSALADGGKIMFFNNGNQRPAGKFSSVEIIEPPIDIEGNYILEDHLPFAPTQASWQYLSQPEPTEFYSQYMAGAQRLANGNTLICEATTGTAFEIDPENNIVWKYINPVSNFIQTQGDEPVDNLMFRFERYPEDYPAFQGKDLTPGLPVELNPVYDCGISAMNDVIGSNLKVYPNPALDILRIDSEHAINGKIEIWNVLGKKVWELAVFENQLVIDISEFPPGVYYVLLEGAVFHKVLILE